MAQLYTQTNLRTTTSRWRWDSLSAEQFLTTASGRWSLFCWELCLVLLIWSRYHFSRSWCVFSSSWLMFYTSLY